jgi:hypothetical protein
MLKTHNAWLCKKRITSKPTTKSAPGPRRHAVSAFWRNPLRGASDERCDEIALRWNGYEVPALLSHCVTFVTVGKLCPTQLLFGMGRLRDVRVVVTHSHDALPALRDV